MKPPRPKIHLLNIPEPLTSYLGLTVRCGVALKNALPKFMFADGFLQYAAIPGICRKCAVLPSKPLREARYLYGLVEAQAERDSQEGE